MIAYLCNHCKKPIDFEKDKFTEKEERKQKMHRDELLHLERGREALRALQEDRNG